MPIYIYMFPLGFSETAQIIAPTWEFSFSVGPMHIHISPWLPWTLHLGLPDPGSNIPQRRRGRTNSLPQGKLSHRKRRAVIAPLLIGTGIAAARGTRIGSISTVAHFYYKLSQELNEGMVQVAESFVSVQRQINSVASVALQNRQALDLLTTEKGGACHFLGEDCCYFVNEMGIVQGRVT